MAPSSLEKTVYLDLSNKYRKCDSNLLAVEVSSVRVIPYTSIKTVNFRAEPSLSSLLKPLPSCSLPPADCDSVWNTLSRAAGEQGRIWEIAADLGPHLQSVGKELFGCPRHPNIDQCGQKTPGYELEELTTYLSTQSHNFCTNSPPSSTASPIAISLDDNSLKGKLFYVFC
jgi:hypothetical protein